MISEKSSLGFNDLGILFTDKLFCFTVSNSFEKY